MRRLSSASALALAAALLGFGMANAQPLQVASNRSNTCFYITQFQNWKAPDARTILVRVDVNRFYRLGLSSACPMLKWPDAHLVMNIHGPDTICSPIDWQLKVNNDMHGVSEPCIVQSMTELTPEEVALIPGKFKP